MEIVVRSAVSADLDALAALNEFVQQLHAAIEPEFFQPAVDSEAVKAFFAQLLVDARHQIILAELSGRPVGYAWFETQERPPTPFSHARRRIYIHHIAVADEARRVGVASALIRSAEDRARLEGINSVVLDAWASNIGARNFFEKKGYSAINLVLRKTVSRKLIGAVFGPDRAGLWSSILSTSRRFRVAAPRPPRHSRGTQ